MSEKDGTDYESAEDAYQRHYLAVDIVDHNNLVH